MESIVMESAVPTSSVPILSASLVPGSSHVLIFFMPLLLSCTPVSNAAEDNAQTDITIVRGEQYAICQDYAAELREHNVRSSNYCGIAIPLDNPDYRLPEWTDLNPSENMELVKTFYYWHNLSGVRTHELFAQQDADRSVIIPELFDLYWPKAEAQVLALIEVGAVQMQTSQFDIDFDGVVETVYRMTPLVRDRGAIPPWSEESHHVFISAPCEEYGLPDAEKEFLYYVSANELPKHDYGGLLRPLRLQLGGFFYWKDRIYWDWARGNVFEPHSIDDIRVTQICGIRIRSIGND